MVQNESEEIGFWCNDVKVLVSPEHYEHISQFQWHCRNDGYIQGIVQGKLWYIHRYIMIEILNKPIPHNHVVDHINNLRHDNRIENLRIVSFSENARNSRKRKTSTSKYYGVHFNKLTKKWRTQVVVDKNNVILAEFEKEIHAAYHYNVLIQKFNINAKLNDITAPKDYNFIPYQKKHNLPRGITYNRTNTKFKIGLSLNKYRSRLLFLTDSLDDAIIIHKMIVFTKTIYNKVLSELKSRFYQKKNQDGNYIFMVKNKEIIIDRNMYQLMFQNTWHISRGYVINSKKERLSRIILDCFDLSLVVDHINGNTFDNRKCNLRIVTPEQNNLNKMPAKSSSSKYIGVFWDKNKNKWCAKIKVQNKQLFLGYFEREQDAALARDYATKKYFKEFGKLNFPERPGWDEYFMNIAEAVKLRSADYHKVGGVLVSLNNKRIIATGYNSFASGINEDIDWSNREFIHDRVIHAEMNVLLYSQSKFEDTILYITTSPCKNCLKALAAANVKKIIYKHEYKDIEDVQKIANELNIEFIEYVNIR